ncbi:MAG: CYTH domain-containing protein, partial [Anaerovibrio sp.]|nr:CYTH domain-containing protein [Anaerovibrio sp.]
MGIEIERKYLINKDKWQPKDEGVSIRQGYLCTDKERTVRIRTKGKKAYLTIKGENEGISRMEMEYEIPFEDATKLLDNLCH